MSTILSSLLESPMVLYTIALTVAWTLVQIISRVSHGEAPIQRIDSGLIIKAFVLYVTLTALLVNMDVSLFPYLHAVMFALTFLSISCSSGASSRSLLMVTLIVALMPVLVMVSTKHPLPLGDDARFIGFAAAIENDGRWVPFKYPENSYYQFFHLIPALEYILASVTGVSIKSITGIMSCYLTLKLTLYLTYFLLLFLVVRKLVGNSSGSLASLLLLSMTPPLALSQVVHQCYAIVLSLASLFALLSMLRENSSSSRADIIIKYPLWLSGVVAHATYTIMLLAFSLPLTLINKPREAQRKIARLAGFILIISLTYWMYTYVMDVIVRPTVDAFDRLTDIITGRAIPFYEAVQPWYGPEHQTFFVAWALIPSMVASHALFSIPLASSIIAFYVEKFVKRAHSKELLNGDHNISVSLGHCVSILGLLGLGGTVINYMLRALPTLGGRYFYWLYLLMLPLSALVVDKVSRKLASLILCIALISMVSLYGVRDPTMSANTYVNVIGWADKNSWENAWIIGSLLPSNAIMISDPRIGAPLSAIKLFSGLEITYPKHGQLPTLLVIGVDDIGYRTLLGAESWYGISLSRGCGGNIVMSASLYEVYYYG